MNATENVVEKLLGEVPNEQEAPEVPAPLPAAMAAALSEAA